jgi:hypothetical protein
MVIPVQVIKFLPSPDGILLQHKNTAFLPLYYLVSQKVYSHYCTNSQHLMGVLEPENLFLVKNIPVGTGTDY